MNNASLKECVKQLKVEGLIDYGIVIPKAFLEEIFKVPCTDTWDWRGPVLQLREHLMDMGYFVSERGMDDGSIRFLSADEIPDFLEKRRKKRYFHMARDMSISKRLPSSSLAERAQKKLFMERDKLGRDLSKLSLEDSDSRKMWVES